MIGLLRTPVWGTGQMMKGKDYIRALKGAGWVLEMELQRSPSQQSRAGGSCSTLAGRGHAEHQV